jgi:hypothetical protein
MTSATTKMMRKMKKSTCAMPAAVDAMPPNPNRPATTAITRKTRAQYSIAFSVYRAARDHQLVAGQPWQKNRERSGSVPAKRLICVI